MASLRFSLLLVEEGERYVEDFGVLLHHAQNHAQPHGGLRGRLKLCTRSLFFEPEDSRHQPLVRVKFSSVLHSGSLRGERAAHVSPEGHEVFVVRAAQYTEVRAAQAWRAVAQEREFCFSLLLRGESHSFLLSFSSMMSFSKMEPRDAAAAKERFIEERRARLAFDPRWIQDLSELRVLQTECERVTPLVSSPLRAVLTNARLYLQPLDNIASEPVARVPLASVRRALKRRHALRPVGLELLLEGDAPSVYLCFHSSGERDAFHAELVALCALPDVAEDLRLASRRWRHGLLSNFEYLTFLNQMSDRSTSDLTQYPVFPWILQDYTSASLDLEDPRVYRDLSKPVGALNPERLRTYRARYQQMPIDPEHPRFLYGTHYSTPGYVLFYLVRKHPQYMLRLQSGKFDDPDRCFDSIPGTFSSCLNAPADVKELIPEFFTDPSFLINSKRLQLGVKQNGTTVDDVELPPWAEGSAQRFIDIHKEALENEHVSRNLHHWIDLIFGYKQQGSEADKADNLFYHLTYEGAVDLESETDPARRRAMEMQIREFGQTPSQLFHEPHPARLPRSEWTGSLPAEPVRAPSPALAAVASPDEVRGVTAVEDLGALALQISVASPEVGESTWDAPSILAASISNSWKLHRERVNQILPNAAGDTLFTVGQDCTFRIFDLAQERQTRSQSLSGVALSACAWIPGTEEKKLIVASYDNHVYTYSLDFARSTDQFYAHDDAVSCMQLTREKLVTGGWDTLVRVWDVEGASFSMDPVAEFAAESEVRCLALAPDGNTLCAAGEEGMLIFCDVRSRSLIRTEAVHEGFPVHSLAFSPDSSSVLSCGADGILKRTHLNGHQLVVHEQRAGFLCMQSDGASALVGDDAGVVSLFDVQKRERLGELCSISSPPTCITVLDDMIYVGTKSGDIKQLIL